MSAADPLLRQTEQFFHAKIPLTKSMGVRVEAYDEGQLILTAPLEVNHNHLGTAFGGSLAAIATLAGYGLIWLQLGDRDAHVVIRDSTISYRHPVRGTIRAICQRPDEASLIQFKEMFQKNGKARLQVRVLIKEDERVCVDFLGTYVALA